MKRTATVKQVRRRYGLEFKERALLRADQDGVALAAKELKLAPSQFYAWRAKARAGSQTSEAQRLNQAEHARLKREVARLEEEVVFLIKAAAYFSVVGGVPDPMAGATTPSKARR